MGSTPICLLSGNFLDRARQTIPLDFNTNNNANSKKQRFYRMRPTFCASVGRGELGRRLVWLHYQKSPSLCGRQTHTASENVSLHLVQRQEIMHNLDSRPFSGFWPVSLVERAIKGGHWTTYDFAIKYFTSGRYPPGGRHRHVGFRTTHGADESNEQGKD